MKRAAKAPAPSEALLGIDELLTDGTAMRADGALVRVLRCGSLNPWVMSDAEGDKLSLAIARMLSRLPAGASIVFLAQARPIRVAELRAATRKRTLAAINARGGDVGAAYPIARLQIALEETLAMHASEDGAVRYDYFCIVSYRPAVAAMALRARPRTVRSHAMALRDLGARVSALRAEMQAQKIESWPLNGAQLAELIWTSTHPTSTDRHGAPESLRDLPAAQVGGRTAEQATQRAAQLRGVLAAPTIVEREGWLQVEEDLHLTMAMSRRPEGISLGWLLGAMQVGLPFSLAVHITARSAKREIGRLRREHRLLHGAEEADARSRRAADYDNRGLRRELDEVNTRTVSGERMGFFDVAIYQTLRLPAGHGDIDDLRQAARRVAEDLSAATNVGVTLGDADQLPLWQSTGALGIDQARMRMMFTSDEIGMFLPFLGSDCGSPQGFPLFYTSGRGLANYDPLDRDAMNYLMTVVGAQGSGKTFVLQAIMQGLLRWGVRGFVIDKADHYAPLAQLVGGRHLQLGAGANAERVNPWDVPDPAAVPDEKITRLLDLHAALIGRRSGDGHGLEPGEESMLDAAIRAVYRAAAAAEIDRPREQALMDALNARAAQDRHAGAGERAGVLEELAARLEQYVGSGTRAWLLDQQTTIPDEGVPLVVFDTRDVPDALEGPVGMILTDYVATVAAQRRGLVAEHADELADRIGAPREWVEWLFSTFLVFDETWSVMQNEATGRNLNTIARRSRHIGLILLAATQRLEDFDNAWGKALLSSAERALYLAQKPRDFEVLGRIGGLTEHELELIDAHVQTSVGRESRGYWINGKRGRGIVSLRVGPTQYWASTSHPADRPLREQALREVGGQDLWAAIDHLLAAPHRELRGVA